MSHGGSRLIKKASQLGEKDRRRHHTCTNVRARFHQTPACRFLLVVSTRNRPCPAVLGAAGYGTHTKERSHGTRKKGTSASGRFGEVGPPWRASKPSIRSAGRAPRRDNAAIPSRLFPANVTGDARGSSRHFEGLFHRLFMRGEAHSISLT